MAMSFYPWSMLGNNCFTFGVCLGVCLETIVTLGVCIAMLFYPWSMHCHDFSLGIGMAMIVTLDILYMWK